MSSITNEQYVAFSNLANYNFYNLPAFGVTLSSITFGADFPLTTPEMTAFDSLSDWKVMYAAHNSDTGFQAVAFEDPDGQVVISFRGTTVTADNWADFFNDAQIAFNNGTFGDPSQFQDTAAFITDVVAMLTGTPASELTPALVKAYFTSRNNDNDPSNQITFTGHSLGGGLCQYASYITGGDAVTFNGVGVGQFIPSGDRFGFAALAEFDSNFFLASFRS